MNETQLSVNLTRLYPSLASRLEQIVRRQVRAPDAVIEEACQVAWSRLAQHADRVTSEKALPWLITTAKREALKQVGREHRECSLDAVLDGAGDLGWLPDACPQLGVAELVEQRERLRSVAELPPRQQQLLMLHAVGYTYAEISAATGDTPRTVERQLLRAKRGVRQLEGAA